MAASVETRVRVERLDIIIATVWPARDVARGRGVALVDFIEFLWATAFRIKVVSSGVDRSARDMRCRGANGEVAGVVAVAGEEEYARRHVLVVPRMAGMEGWRRGIMLGVQSRMRKRCAN